MPAARQPIKDGFLKIPRVVKTGANDEAASKDSKYRRVAKFLILIGAEQAASILTNLEPEQVELISREIASIRGIQSDEAAEILAEFQSLLEGSFPGQGRTAGGLDEARRLLYAAFGPEKGEAFLKNAAPAARETSFSFLDDLPGEQIAILLRDESPATGAMILSRIAPKSAAAALSCADREWRLEVARRISRLGQVSPEVLERTVEALREKARRLSGSAGTSTVDGLGALASILKQSDVSFGDTILSELSKEDPELGRELKDRLYTLDDVIKADNKPLRIKLHAMSAKEIALLIKGRSEVFAEKILANISSNRKIEVREELDFMGPVTKKDSDAALKIFMNWFREGREEGSILMLGDDIVE
jgi:flagellar motor switch protein FliG